MHLTKENVKIWLKNPRNLVIIGIFILAFLIRIYYWNYAAGQALWWDEAEYMATAKHWALGVPYDLNPQRPPLFQLIAAGLIILGFSEQALKFFLVVIPSLASVVTIYFLGSSLFNKKVGVISAVLGSFMWSYLFWSARFQPDFLSLTFQLLSVLFFWELFKKPSKKYAILAGSFAAIGFYFKISALLVPLSIAIFVLYKDGFKAFKNKNYWISLLAFILTMVPFMVWQFFIFGSPTAFAPSYIGETGIGQNWSYGWQAITYYLIFPKVLFFLFFVIGLALILFHFLLRYDKLFKDKEIRNSAEVFSLIILIVSTLFYIFYIRGVIEDRWVFLMFPFISFISAKGLIRLTEMTNSRKIATILIIFALAFYSYSHLNHTTQLIQNKIDSYGPVKDSSIWIKDNSNTSDKILSISYTQTTSYAEREVIEYRNWEMEMFERVISEEKPRFLMVSIFENHPPWINDWINDNMGRLEVVQYYTQAGTQQPVLIVYQIKDS